MDDWSTHSLTHLYIHFLAHLPSPSLTHSLTDSLIYSLTYSLLNKTTEEVVQKRRYRAKRKGNRGIKRISCRREDNRREAIWENVMKEVRQRKEAVRNGSEASQMRRELCSSAPVHVSTPLCKCDNLQPAMASQLARINIYPRSYACGHYLQLWLYNKLFCWFTTMLMHQLQLGHSLL